MNIKELEKNIYECASQDLHGTMHLLTAAFVGIHMTYIRLIAKKDPEEQFCIEVASDNGTFREITIGPVVAPGERHESAVKH